MNLNGQEHISDSHGILRLESQYHRLRIYSLGTLVATIVLLYFPTEVASKSQSKGSFVFRFYQYLLDF